MLIAYSQSSDTSTTPRNFWLENEFYKLYNRVVTVMLQSTRVRYPYKIRSAQIRKLNRTELWKHLWFGVGHPEDRGFLPAIRWRIVNRTPFERRRGLTSHEWQFTSHHWIHPSVWYYGACSQKMRAWLRGVR